MGDAGGALPPVIERMYAQATGQDHAIDPYVATYPCAHPVTRGLVPGQRLTEHYPGYNWELPGPGRALTQGFEHALTRLADRATARGAHGVIDIRMEVVGDELFRGTMDITLTGTAVAYGTELPLPRPFTAGLSGQAFSKMVQTGMIPVKFCLGAAVLSSWIGCQTRTQLESGYSFSVEQIGDALVQVRDVATALMWKQTDLSDAPFVEVTLHHAHARTSKTEFRTSAWSAGTVVQPFAPTASPPMSRLVVPMRQQ
ncbi:MAG TPA: heavy metal-binding domain-containing protein [Acidimicrobiales bacterium]|jgi:hypothetical protein|nr:heavy metal-binding domain-containing protein [Acidimicrobiales bacterium]